MTFDLGWEFAPAKSLSQPPESGWKATADARPSVPLEIKPWILNGWKEKTVWFRSPVIPDLPYENPVLYSPLVNQSIRIYLQSPDGNLNEIYNFGRPELGKNGYAGWPNHLIDLPAYAAGCRIYALVYSETISASLAPASALTIGERSERIQSILRRDLARVSLGFLFFVVGSFCIVLFLRNLSQSLLGAFGLFALASGIYVVSNRTLELQHLLYYNPRFWMDLEHISIFLMPPTFGLFLIQVLPDSRVLRPIAAVLLGYAILGFVAHGFGVLWYDLLYPFFYLTLLAALTIAVVILRHALGGSNEARIILIGLGFFLGTAIYDMLGALALIYWPFQAVTWGFMGFQVALGSILYLRYSDTHRQLAAYSQNLEKMVEKRTEDLDRSLREVRKLKEKQDGDYFLISLLMHPLRPRDLIVGDSRVVMDLRQKKQFEYRGRKSSIGGDVCLARELELQDRKYVAFLNGDAMGKSMQGAGGAVVLGTAFGSLIERARNSASDRNRRPETFLRDSFRELNRVFLAFEGSMLTTMLLGVLDVESGQLHFINCEHPMAAILRNKEAVYPPQELTTKLGLAEPSAEPVVNQLQLQPGDAFCVGSDGKDDVFVIDAEGEEVRNQDDGLFLRLLMEYGPEPSRMLDAIEQSGEVTDDLSLLSVLFH